MTYVGKKYWYNWFKCECEIISVNEYTAKFVIKTKFGIVLGVSIDQLSDIPKEKKPMSIGA